MKAKRTLVACLGAVLGIAVTTANAISLASIKVMDVGSTNPDGSYNPTLDGRSGGFGFDTAGNINPVDYSLPSGGSAILWTGDGNNGGFILGGAGGQGKWPAADSFTTGMTFAASPFRPYVGASGVNIDVTATGSLAFNTFDFASDWESATATFSFNLHPDSAPEQFWAVPGQNPGDWLVSFARNHLLPSDVPEPVDRNARWIIEGIVTPVPVPAAAWLFGSGLVSLVEGCAS